MVLREKLRSSGKQYSTQRGSPTEVALFGPGIDLSTEDNFGFKPICIGLRESYYIIDSEYLRCGFVLSLYFTYLRCGVGSGKNKNLCVPEVPSAEQASKRYSNEALCFGTRCCVDPEVVLRVDQRGAARCKEKNDLFL